MRHWLSVIGLALAYLVAIALEILLYALIAEHAVSGVMSALLVVAMVAMVPAVAAYTRYQVRHIGGHEKRTGDRRAGERRKAEAPAHSAD